MLLDQKPLIYAYFVDETGDEMAAGNASLAVVYSGEAAYAQSLSDKLEYSVPKEGSNLWLIPGLSLRPVKIQKMQKNS